VTTDQGYRIFRDAIAVDALAKAEEACRAAIAGPLPRHLNKTMRRKDFEELPPVQRTRYGLLNAHLLDQPELQPFTGAFTRMLVSDAMFDCLHAVDGEEHYTLHQTIFFFESPITVPHIEAMTLDTIPRGRSHTVWMAIDDVTPLNGPPFVVPVARGQYDPYPTGDSKEHHRAMVLENIVERNSPVIALALGAGSLAIWAPSTPHGSMPPHPGYEQRRSFQAIYRPTRIARWGEYPNHDQPHEPESEEIRINPRFSFLRAAMP
jgi:ectoine hydroxylase-related dioxygenase (phytanoyl-CoA dioxygenase family)